LQGTVEHAVMTDMTAAKQAKRIELLLDRVRARAAAQQPYHVHDGTAAMEG
jgi:hypothetical protein